MAYLSFLRNMWLMRKVTEAQLQSAVTKEYITQEEANQIIAIPQIPQ
jgi:hypothetical protein